jgi:hypothetical protein
MFEGVNLEELKTRCLEVCMYDETNETKKSDKDKHFAFIRIGSGGLIEKWDDSQGEEVDLWFHMLNNPETWTSKLIPLRMLE